MAFRKKVVPALLCSTLLGCSVPVFRPLLPPPPKGYSLSEQVAYEFMLLSGLAVQCNLEGSANSQSEIEALIKSRTQSKSRIVQLRLVTINNDVTAAIKEAMTYKKVACAAASNKISQYNEMLHNTKLTK